MSNGVPEVPKLFSGMVQLCLDDYAALDRVKYLPVMNHYVQTLVHAQERAEDGQDIIRLASGDASPCCVCMAGAVMVGTLGMDLDGSLYETAIGPYDIPSCYPEWTQAINSLELLRQGEYSEAAYAWSRVHKPHQEWYRQWAEHQYGELPEMPKEYYDRDEGNWLAGWKDIDTIVVPYFTRIRDSLRKAETMHADEEIR